MKTTRSEHDSELASGEKLVGSDRVLAVLTELAEHPAGISLDEIARAVSSPKPTTHRALAALRRAGFASQDKRGHYVLGDTLLRMAFAYHEARPDHVRVQATLQLLADYRGETAHYAVLDGRSVVYRSKVDPPAGAVRLTSTVGGRNPAHATAVGKLLLSFALPDRAAVRAWVGKIPLERPTARTKVTVDELHEELSLIRELGYSVDDQENELGINCIAVPAYLTSPTVPSGAISISAVAYRTPMQTLIDDLPRMRRIIEDGHLDDGE
jgi:IclR family acetate operon transcriptional repressor